MAKGSVAEFKQKYQVSGFVYSQIQRVAGMFFSNQSLLVDFKDVVYAPVIEQELIKVDLSHVGVGACAYIKKRELDRVLGVQLRYFDREYVEYLIAQKLEVHGVRFNQWLDGLTGDEGLVLIHSAVSVGGWQMGVLFDIESLNIDDTFLSKKAQSFPGDLPLKVAISPFETWIGSHEIGALSSNDVVFVQCR